MTRRRDALAGTRKSCTVFGKFLFDASLQLHNNTQLNDNNNNRTPRSSHGKYPVGLAPGRRLHCKRRRRRRLPWVTPIGNSALLWLLRSATPHTRPQSIRRCVCWRKVCSPPLLSSSFFVFRFCFFFLGAFLLFAPFLNCYKFARTRISGTRKYHARTCSCSSYMTSREGDQTWVVPMNQSYYYRCHNRHYNRRVVYTYRF